jgi:hypothetical protein
LDHGEINAAQGRVEQPERHNDGIAKSEVSAFQVSFDRFGDTPRSERAGLRPASSRLQYGMAQETQGCPPLAIVTLGWVNSCRGVAKDWTSIVAHGRNIAVIGLGYVGLPVAVSFARSGVPVVGFDVDAARVAELRDGKDRTREVESSDLHQKLLLFTADPAEMGRADFFIVTVPTPIDEARRPDLRAMIAASRSVAAVLKKGDIVVYESTVYPGAVEEECVPILEENSRLKAGVDFAVGQPREPSGISCRSSRVLSAATVSVSIPIT